MEWYDQRSPHTKAYDRYLLKQQVNSTTEEVNLSENIGYDAIVGALNLPPEVYAQDVQGTLWPLRKNHQDLDEEERLRLRRLFQHTPRLHQTYTLRYNNDFAPSVKWPPSAGRNSSWGHPS